MANRERSTHLEPVAEEVEQLAPGPYHHRDAAAEFLNKNPEQRVVVTSADDKRILRRIDLFILPIMLVVYFLQGLDKATLSYASVFGLADDTGLVGDQYSWLGSIVYLAQLIMQPLLAYLLVRLPIGKFTSVTVCLWGVALSCMAAAPNFSSLLATRFFLGAFEAGVAPSFVAITQMWWRRREQTVRTTYWYSMNGLTFMFGSLITYGLGHISSSLHSYQIIFLFFGIITVVFSFVMFWFMPDSPMEARFLEPRDKLIAIERLRMNQMGVVSREWRNDHLREALFDPKTWLWFCLIFSISIPSGGISTFGPLIISTFGFNSFQTILFNIPFGLVQLIACLVSGFLSQRIKMKGPIIALLCFPAIAGCIVLSVLPHEAEYRVPLLAGYYILSVYPGITPLIYAWSSQNTAGDTKRKCNSAVLFVGQSAGNVIGPLLYTTEEAPAYPRGLHSNLAMYCIIIILVGITSAYLAFLNKTHAKKRVALGKSAVIIDTSLQSADEVAIGQAAIINTTDVGTIEGIVARTQATGDRAFDNLTDLQNEEFIFVY
ncbi:major facilitator superfamily transporter [Xylariales sp. PMI_506]|nr:major facilitator superfamily transporter [Xylariales sp. PMI_506]